MPPRSTPLVSIITLHFNQLQATLNFLESSRQLTYPNYELIVCDMDSDINYVNLIRNKNFKNTSVYRSPENLGYAGGNNWGLAKARGEYVFFVNNDTLLTPGIIEGLLQPMLDNRAIAGVSPKIISIDEPRVIQYAGFQRMNLFTGRALTIGNGETDTGQYNQSGATGSVHGSAMMVRRSVIDQIGMFPKKFFLYYEEWDWSLRAQELGFILWYAADALIYHKGALSVGKSNPLQTYYHTRNRILLMRRNTQEGQYFLFILFFTFVSIPKGVLTLLIHGRFKKLGLFWQAILWNFRNTNRSPVS